MRGRTSDGKQYPFSANGGILPPSEWPEDIKKLVTGYNAGTVTAAEKITFCDRIDLGFKLLDRIQPLLEKPPEPTHVNNVQMNVDKLMLDLRAPLPAQ